MKKILALVLALVMLFSLMPMTVFAEENTEVTENVIPIEEPVEQPIEEPMEQPIEEPMEQPIEEPVEQPIEEPVEQPIEEPVEQPIEEPMEEPMEEPTEAPSEKPTEEEIYVTVTFNMNGYGEEIEQQTIVLGASAVKPVDPEVDGFIFTGWYTEPEFENLWDFANPVNADMVLYAAWEEDSEFLAALLAGMPLLTMGAPTVEVLDGDGTQIGTYETLEAAFAEATSGYTVKLLADTSLLVEEETEFNISGVTFDLNEKTLNVTAGFVFFTGSDFTVTNGTVTSDGSDYGLVIYNASNVNVSKIISADPLGFIGSTATVSECNIDTANNDFFLADEGSNVTVTSGSYSSADFAATVTEGSTLTISGGTFNQDVSDYCAEGFYCSSNNDGTYSVKELPTVATVNSVNYTDLAKAISEAIGTDYSVEIVDNIDLSEKTWTPVVYNGGKLTINGNNKTITGMSDSLLNKTGSGGHVLSISNLTFDNCSDTTALNDGAAIILPYADCVPSVTFNNVCIKNSTVNAGANWTGAFIGYYAAYYAEDAVTFNDCSVVNCTIIGNGSTGGLMGHGNGNPNGTVTVNNATITGNTIKCVEEGKTNKAGSVIATIGSGTNPISVSATVSDNTVTSTTATITTIYGRQGNDTGTLTLTGGSYDSKPIADNDSAWAAPKEGFELKENGSGTYTVEEIVVAMIGVNKYDTLTKAFSAAQNGDTVTLLAETFDDNDLAALQNLNGKTVTVVGQGTDKTALKVDYGTAGCHVTGSSTVTFKNLAITFKHNSGMPYTQSLSGMFENVKINGMIATVYGKSTFTNCVFTGSSADEYILWVYSGELVLDGCTFEGTGTKGSVKLYGEAGSKIAVNISGTEFKTVGSKGCAVYSSNGNNTTAVVYEVNIADDVTAPAGAATVKASGNGLSVINPTKNDQGKYTAGTFLTENTNEANVKSYIEANAADYYVSEKNDDGSYGIKCHFYRDETDENLWHVVDAEGLFQFAAKVNAGTSFQNKTISIDADCDISANEWTPINAYQNGSALSGATIEGNSHKITGMNVAGESGYGHGFISQQAGALTVNNLEFVNANVSASSCSQVGVVCGMTYGNVTLNNVDLTNCTVSGETKTGGYIGQNDDGTVTLVDCDLKNTTVKANYAAALMVGLLNTNSNGAQFTDCTADDNSAFNWVSSEFAQKGVLIDGRYYAIDGTTLWLTDPGADCWAEQRVNGAKLSYGGSEYDVKGSVFYPEYVAVNAETYYTSLKAALEAAKEGETVKLLTDTSLFVEEETEFDISGVTLDLNEKTLNVTAGSVFFAGSDFTVTNGTVTADGSDYGLVIYNAVNVNVSKITSADPFGFIGCTATVSECNIDTDNNDFFLVDECANVTVTSGNYSSTDFAATVTEGGTLTISGGTFNQNVSDYCADGYFCKDNGDGTYTVCKTVAKIDSTSYESLEAAIANAKSGDTIVLLADTSLLVAEETEYDVSGVTLDLNEKTLNVTAGSVFFTGDDFTVTNGTVTSDGSDYGLIIYNANNVNVSKITSTEPIGFLGSTATVSECNIDTDNNDFFLLDESSNITVTSGNYSSTDFAATVTEGSTLTISGGTFNQNVSDYCADGYFCKDNGNGTYTVYKAVAKIDSTSYESLEAAIANANPGDTIVLLADLDLTEYAEKEYHAFNLSGLTLDLAEFTVISNEGGFAFVGEDFTVTNGTFQSTDSSKIALTLGDDDTTDDVILDGVTFSELALYKATDVTVRNCASTSTANACIGLQSGSSAKIESGTFNYNGTVAIFSVPADCTLEITGGTYNKDVDQYCAEGYGCRETSSGSGVFTVLVAPEITLTCADIEKDGTPDPQYETKYTEATPVITYSADGINYYATWDEVKGEAGTYYVKAYIAATETSHEAVATTTFLINSGCAHIEIVSIAEGRYLLYLNDVEVGYVNLTKANGKWAINVEGKGYISYDGNNVSYSATPYYWSYNGIGFYVIKSETTGVIFKKTKQVTYYLSYGGESTGYPLTKNTTMAIFMDVVTDAEHEYAYRDNGDGTHTKYCSTCGKEYETSDCKYDDSTHRCSLCDAYDPSAVSVNCNVTVIKTYNTSSWTRFWHGDYTYSVLITAAATGDTVQSIQYSTDNKSWVTGHAFSQYKAVNILYVKVNTANNGTYNFVYQNGTTTPV